MKEEIHYIKADPSGNTTILVLDAVPQADHAALSEQLLRPDCIGAEQVGFLSRPAKDADIRLDMMGGEFCGNASRAAAAYLLSKTDDQSGEYLVSCSGCNHPLRASVQRDEEEGLYMASIEMPLPKEMDMVTLKIGNGPIRFYRVALPGIVHFVHFAPCVKKLDREQIWQAVFQYAAGQRYSAFGLDLVDRKTLSMIPAVYVAGTGTVYWEQSCGSGSAAMAAALGRLCGHDIACETRQPGGSITIEAAYSDAALKSIRIGGPVRLGKEMTVCVDKAVPGTV